MNIRIYLNLAAVAMLAVAIYDTYTGHLVWAYVELGSAIILVAMARYCWLREDWDGFEPQYGANTHYNKVCGYCHEPGADKMAKWVTGGTYLNGEFRPATDVVHATCERAEAKRALEAGLRMSFDSATAKMDNQQ